MKAVILFSGGLDSRLALKLMLQQGVCLHALHFRSVLEPRAQQSQEAVAAAERLGVPVTVQDITEELLCLVQHPPHGHGSGMNPCIDCRIMQLRRARALMGKIGADFIVTGEVLGQRPMTQRKDAMRHIQREAGVEDLVVRPLCAKALEPTLPEREGWVDRERLKGFTGRQRRPQMELAEQMGITDYPSPAGGCRLTEPGFARRVQDLVEHGELSVPNVHLLGVGRHFRLGSSSRLIVGRNEQENARIEELARPEHCLLMARDWTGPTSLMAGEMDGEALRLAARITARYGKGRDQPEMVVQLSEAHSAQLAVPPAGDEELDAYRV